MLDKINPYLKKTNFVISFLLLVILFSVLMIHLSQEIRDLDIWLHLKTGEQIILNKSVPLTDPYSFTQENKAWINHEWLFQLISYVIYSQFGFDGLIVLQNIVFIAIFFIMFLMGVRNRNFLFVTTMLFILLLNINYRFTVRPDMFSVFFLVLFIFILKEKKEYLFLLPFLQILWANFHGFFLIGPLIIFIFAVTEKNKKLWIVFCLSIISTLANPQFLKGAVYPFVTFISLLKDNFIFNFVQELEKPITFKNIFNLGDWLFLKALIIISIFSFRFNQKKFSLKLFLLWFIFLLFSLSAIRNIIYFALISAIVIFHNINERFSYDKNFSNEKFIDNKFYFIGRYALVFSFAFCMIRNANINLNSNYYDFTNYSFKSGLWGISTKNYPKNAVDFILKEGLPQRIFNDFNSGSYLIGRTYPKRKVFIDGRTEFYGNEFLKQYKEIANGNAKIIKDSIEKYNLEGFLLSMAMSNFDEKLAKYLFESPEWKPVYFDETAIIFLKNTPKNKNLIDKFYIDLKSWKAPKTKFQKIGTKIIYPYEYIKRGQALKEIGCFEAAISEANEALKIMPNCAEAFGLSGDCYLELKNYLPALENLRIALAFMPYAFDLRNKYALSLYKLGYLKEAEAELFKIVRNRPKDPENYNALALVYRKKGDLRKAQIMEFKARKYSEKENNQNNQEKIL